MKPLKMDDEQIKANEFYDNKSYKVVDPEEAMLLVALREDNSIVSDKDIKKILGN